jgi:hypothetical protein
MVQRDPHAAREGRRLAGDGAACGVELLFQFFVFAAQPLRLRLRPPQVLTQLVVLPTESLDLAGLGGWPIGLALRHTMLMPDSRAQYKWKLRASTADPRRQHRGPANLIRWALGVGRLLGVVALWS